MEHWLDPTLDESTLRKTMEMLVEAVERHGLDFCSLGGCSSSWALAATPILLAVSSRLSSSYRIDQDCPGPLLQSCKEAARTVIDLSRREPSGSANFNFCVAFNCPPQIPFFPAAHHPSGQPDTLTVGLESGDLLFLAFHGVGEDYSQGSSNLQDVMKQSLQPLEAELKAACQEAGLLYGGIDASINPGLTPQESVAAGIENLYPYRFGSTGTLAAVAAVTSAIKSLHTTIQLTGYSGLMLPVMEDLVLAARAGNNSSIFCTY